jgi:hypothetical protein
MRISAKGRTNDNLRVRQVALCSAPSKLSGAKAVFSHSFARARHEIIRVPIRDANHRPDATVGRGHQHQCILRPRPHRHYRSPRCFRVILSFLLIANIVL